MRACLGLMLCAVISACAESPAPIDVAAEESALMETSREWSEVAATGDLDATLSYWADDAVILSPGQPPIRGKDAIRSYVEATGSIPGFRIRWEPLEAHVSADGDMGYLIERNQITFQDSTGATIVDSNKVVTVWRKQEDGTWKNVVDAWNSDPTAWER